MELNHLFEKSFPGILLRSKQNFLDLFRTESMLACWNEFGACWRSAPLGPTEQLFYEPAFLSALDQTRAGANEAIIEYRIDADIRKVTHKVCKLYGGLLKYSAYHLGNLHGHGVNWQTVPTTNEPLENHWFLPYFIRLDNACKDIASSIGDWEKSNGFEELKNLAEDLIAEGGMHFERHPNDRISLNIPYSTDTLPPKHLWR